MNQDDVERVVKGEQRPFRPLHELLAEDIKVESSQEAIERWLKEIARAKPEELGR